MKWFAAILLCVVMVGCDTAPKRVQKYQPGQMVELRIGLRGQIIRITTTPRGEYLYVVRVNTEHGPTINYLNEFELTITRE